ncbi:MAG: SDR family oxidoreductase [Myxococcota bacterium]
MTPPRALITGSGHLGRTGNNLARTFAEQGIQPILHYRSSGDGAQRTLDELDVDTFAVQGDLTRPGVAQRIVDEIQDRVGGLEIVVHPIGNYNRLIWETNVDSAKAIAQAALPLLLKADYGRIVFFGAAGIERPEKAGYAPDYQDAKRALLRYARALAVDHIAQGVTVNMVSPGEMTYSILDAITMPLGRAVTPDELARAVMFFIDPQAGAVTGQNLEVAGGLHL